MSGTIKARGVYTTLALQGHPLDLPGPNYLCRRTFGFDETPAAVVTGYGDFVGDVNYPETYELRLIERASGVVLETFNHEVHAGKAAVVALPIRKSGDYRLELIIQGATADIWDFSVKRAASTDAVLDGASPASYAKGEFSAGMENYKLLDEFKEYDSSFLWSLNVAIYHEYKRANPNDFAQMPAGRVVIGFDLNATGQVTSPTILENTLSDAFGEFFLRALQNGAPYKNWPADARAALGTPTRHMKVTFRYN
jgi:hypothetical protein